MVTYNLIAWQNDISKASDNTKFWGKKTQISPVFLKVMENAINDS